MAAVALATAQIPSSFPSSTVRALSELEHRLAKAAVERDLNTYGSLLSGDWTTIDVSGRVLDRAQVLDELQSGERRLQAASIDELRVRDLGEVAVVTGRTTATGSYRGETVTVVLRFTDVFARRDGEWKVVASQGTLVGR
jgi:ketosteroid isomerase-like protein